MTTKHYFIYTFGCAMNEYDTERIAAALEAKGYIPSDKVNDSDFIVLNTCSVREKPQVKILSYLGQIRLLKEKNPNIILSIWDIASVPITKLTTLLFFRNLLPSC